MIWNASTGAVSYDVYMSGLFLTNVNGMTTVNVTGLAPGRSFNFTVRARGLNGLVSGHSNTLTASTLSSAPSGPPAPTNLRVNGSPTTTVIPLAWNASAGAVAYEVFVNGLRAGEIPGTGVNIINLVPGTSYSFIVRARNASNVFSGHSNTLTASTLSGAPSAPPVPTNLRLRDADDALTDTQIRLVWNASPGATGYYLYQNGVRIFTATGTAVMLSGRAPNTSFTFTVRARNENGTSGHSAPLTVRTLAGAPGGPPAPTGLRLSDAADALTDTQIRLRWNASPGATGHDLYQNGVRLNLSDPNLTAVILRNRTPNTSFTFTVRARNASGGSAHSAPLTVRTLAGTGNTGLTVNPSNVTAPALGNTSPVFTVTSSTDWTATRPAGVTWFEVIRAPGAPTFTVRILPHTSTAPRTSHVTVSNGSSSQTISVNQQGAFLTIPHDAITLPTAAGHFPIWVPPPGVRLPSIVQVTSNAIWQISTTANWLTLNTGHGIPIEGHGNGSFTITATPNTSSNSRSAIVQVSVGSSIQRTITVSQRGQRLSTQEFMWPVADGQPNYFGGKAFISTHLAVDISNENNVAGFSSWTPLPAGNHTPSGHNASRAGARVVTATRWCDFSQIQT